MVNIINTTDVINSKYQLHSSCKHYHSRHSVTVPASLDSVVILLTVHTNVYVILLWLLLILWRWLILLLLLLLFYGYFMVIII